MAQSANSKAGRKLNFSGEQCGLPEQVLQTIQDEWWNVQGVGVTMLEMFNKQPKYLQLIKRGEDALRSLLSIPDNFKVYTMAGGQALQISAVPLNLLGSRTTASYFNTGWTSERAIEEAQRFASNINVIESLSVNGSGKTIVKAASELSEDTAYVHYVSTEPVEGITLNKQPQRQSSSSLVVADLSADFLHREIDWTLIDVAYVSSEFQAGIAGSMLLIIRESAIPQANPKCPFMLDYAELKATDGVPNTPPTFPMYVNAQMFLYAASIEGGVKTIASRTAERARRIYAAIDAHPFVYATKVAEEWRSNTHIVFTVKGVQQDQHFLEVAEQAGITGLNFRRSNSLRASLNLGTTDQAVEALVAFINDYAKKVTVQSSDPTVADQ